LTGSEKGPSFNSQSVEKGIFRIMMDFFNNINIIVITSAVGILLSLLLLLVGVIDLRRPGLVMT
jgi:hypothetical protein